MRRFLSTFVLVALGCDGSGAPSLHTGLPSNEPANQLSPAEAMAACQAYENVANQTLGVADQQKIACTVTGIIAQLGGVEPCTTAYAACLEQVPITTYVPIDFSCETAVSFAPSGCTATIGELEDCVNALAAGIDSVEHEISCGLASDLNRLANVLADANASVMPATYPACASLSAECLGLLGWAQTSLPSTTVP